VKQRLRSELPALGEDTEGFIGPVEKPSLRKAAFAEDVHQFISKVKGTPSGILPALLLYLPDAIF